VLRFDATQDWSHGLTNELERVLDNMVAHPSGTGRPTE